MSKKGLTLLAVGLGLAALLATASERDLSTPLSRLVGHWKTQNGFEWHFYPASPAGEGVFLRLWPDKATLMDYQKKIIRKSLEGKAAEAEIEKQIREAEAALSPKAGTGELATYRLVEQDAVGTRIVVRIFLPEAKPEEGEQDVFYVEKDGLTMKKFLKPPAGPPKTELPSVDENPITYVDAVLPVIPKKK